jgi:hypothetical protein
MELVRGTPSLPIFIEKGAVVILIWEDVKSSANTYSPELLGKYKALFAKCGWHPITLINATFQLELAHHLDDEISKQLGYAHSASVAEISDIRDVFLRKMGFLPYKSLYDFELFEWQPRSVFSLTNHPGRPARRVALPDE